MVAHTIMEFRITPCGHNELLDIVCLVRSLWVRFAEILIFADHKSRTLNTQHLLRSHGSFSQMRTESSRQWLVRYGTYATRISALLFADWISTLSLLFQDEYAKVSWILNHGQFLFSSLITKCRRLHGIRSSFSLFFSLSAGISCRLSFDWPLSIVLLTQLTLTQPPHGTSSHHTKSKYYSVSVKTTIAGYRIYEFTFSATSIFAFKLRFNFNFDYVCLSHTCFHRKFGNMVCDALSLAQTSE